VNLLPTVGRAGPKPQLTPDGRSMRGNCSGTNHRRAELKRTLADFNGNGQSGSQGCGCGSGILGGGVSRRVGCSSSVRFGWPPEAGIASLSGSTRRFTGQFLAGLSDPTWMVVGCDDCQGET